jgi:hypothetical protein
LELFDSKAGVAQWPEQGFCKPQVTRSNRVASSIIVFVVKNPILGLLYSLFFGIGIIFRFLLMSALAVFFPGLFKACPRVSFYLKWISGAIVLIRGIQILRV